MPVPALFLPFCEGCRHLLSQSAPLPGCPVTGVVRLSSFLSPLPFTLYLILTMYSTERNLRVSVCKWACCAKLAPAFDQRSFGICLTDQLWDLKSSPSKLLNEARCFESVWELLSLFLEHQRSVWTMAGHARILGASVFDRRQTFCESAANFDGQTNLGFGRGVVYCQKSYFLVVHYLDLATRTSEPKIKRCGPYVDPLGSRLMLLCTVRPSSRINLKSTHRQKKKQLAYGTALRYHFNYSTTDDIFSLVSCACIALYS